MYVILDCDKFFKTIEIFETCLKESKELSIEYDLKIATINTMSAVVHT